MEVLIKMIYLNSLTLRIILKLCKIEHFLLYLYIYLYYLNVIFKLYKITQYKIISKYVISKMSTDSASLLVKGSIEHFMQV